MIDTSLTLEQIREDIIRFKNDPDFQKLENFYYSKSFPEILGVSRREISHSSFIAWLLDPSESHNLSYYPIKRLLDIVLNHSSQQQKQQYGELFNAFVTDDYLLKDVNVIPEFVIKGVGRLDIYLEMKISNQEHQRDVKIIIENKVESKEANDQTTNYFNYFEKNKGENDLIIYVYLTAISTLDLIELEEPECNCKSYIHINYQSLADYLLEPALNQNISQKTKNIITEYLHSLSQPSINDEAEGHKQELIMALGNDERKLLTSFWNKNQRLIMSALYAISSDPEQEKDTRESITQALDNLTQDKDRSTYRIFFNDNLVAQGFKKSDIGLQTIKALDTNGIINSDVIEYLKQDKTCTFPLIKKREEFTELEIKYRKYKTNSSAELVFDGGEYYVARNWGKNSVDKFIKKFSERFPQLKYEQL